MDQDRVLGDQRQGREKRSSPFEIGSLEYTELYRWWFWHEYRRCTPTHVEEAPEADV